MKLVTFLMLFTSLLHADEDLIKLSFFRGHILWKEQLERPGVAYDFEQVIEGMRAADRGEAFQTDNQAEHDILVKKLQQTVLAKQQNAHLSNAERFMTSVSMGENIVELIKGKLCFQQLKAGSGSSVVKAGSEPILTYSARVLEMEGEEDFVPVPNPTRIFLPSTIPGFAQGVVGMRIGEQRRIYVHPDLAYGLEEGLVGPNRLMIFDVEVVSVD